MHVTRTAAAMLYCTVPRRYALAEAQVARMSDFGKNDTVLYVRTHLGNVLKPGGAYACGMGAAMQCPYRGMVFIGGRGQGIRRAGRCCSRAVPAYMRGAGEGQGIWLPCKGFGGFGGPAAPTWPPHTHATGLARGGSLAAAGGAAR